MNSPIKLFVKGMWNNILSLPFIAVVGTDHVKTMLILFVVIEPTAAHKQRNTCCV